VDLLQKALTSIINRLEMLPGVEGAFLSGSLANEHRDDFSDIDLGIATKDSAKTLNQTFALRHELIGVVGQPIHYLERGWEHCKMIAALFGKSQFPPVGLEIDLIFSQLQHVSEQMPYSDYMIVSDRNGKLQSILAKTNQSKPGKEIEHEISQHLKWFPFYTHDALKACKRSDEFQVRSLLEEMRKSIFFVAATRRGRQVFGAKRAYHYLSTSERQIVEQSYSCSDEDTVARIAQLYVELVTQLQSNYQIDDAVISTKTILQELL